MMITALIPVRNREHLIARAVQSVAAQTRPVDELVVIDDASTDHTRDVVERLAKSLHNIRLVSLKENVGAARARNIGIELAEGDLIAFLDSDDVWHVDKLAKQAKEFETHSELVAVFCGVEMVSDGTTYRHHYIPKPEIVLSDLYHSSLLVTMSCALVSRKALQTIGGFDVSLPSCQDWDLFMRLSEIGKLAVVQEILVEFWRHTGDRISRNKISVLAGHDAVFEKIYRRISDPRLMRRVRASHEMRMADIFSIDCFEPFRAIGHSYRSLLLGPSREAWYNFRSVIKRSIKKAIFERN